jgi:putative ribosome biogenesis GTPase RsgA
MAMPLTLGNSLNLGPIIGKHESLRLSPKARDKHLYVIGATGVGKSKFLEHLVRQDILAWSKTKCGSGRIVGQGTHWISQRT